LKRVTVNVPDEELEWIEENIRTKVFHNYQHAIEYCIHQVMVRSREGGSLIE